MATEGTRHTGDDGRMSQDVVAVGNGRYEILPGSPLPALDSPGGPAFAARGIRDRRTDCFAIVCQAAVPVRMDMLTPLRALENMSLMRVLDWGVVEWAPEGVRRFAIVFEKPAGPRVMTTLQDTREPLSEDQIIRMVFQPLGAILKELASRSLVHGGIRPTNLFLREPSGGGFMLGESVSTPPFYGQPALFCPIERAAAQPSGRGQGSTADDLYALGVTAVLLLLGRNPLRHLDDEAILNLKIERGSYPVLVGNMRLSLSLMEVLRGLLSDDVKQRWSVNDLDLWLSGRRLSPKQPALPKRAARPLEFGGQEYWYTRILAQALARNPSAAAAVIDDGSLDRWLRRSLADDARAEAVANAVSTASATGRGVHFEDRLVARVCMALDPVGPIRYRQRAVMIDGIGPALAEAFLSGDQPQIVAEMLAGQLHVFWINLQPEFRPELLALVQSLDGMRALLERSAPEFGIERLLYELNPGLPCLSPLVQGRYATTGAEILTALDAAAAHAGREGEPFDRHIAGFLLARYRRLDEKMFAQTAPGVEPARRATAMLTILADIQRRHGPAELPGLCAWMVRVMDPAIQRFHSRPERKRLREEAQRLARGGNLAVLLALIDNPQAIRQDEAGFASAQAEWKAAATEIERLQRDLDRRGEDAEAFGRQVAAAVASMLGTLAMIGVILLSMGAS